MTNCPSLKFVRPADCFPLHPREVLGNGTVEKTRVCTVLPGNKFADEIDSREKNWQPREGRERRSTVLKLLLSHESILSPTRLESTMFLPFDIRSLHTVKRRKERIKAGRVSRTCTEQPSSRRQPFYPERTNAEATRVVLITFHGFTDTG